MRELLGAALLVIATPAAAEWVLDNEASRLTFTSIKAGTVAEVNQFDELAGAIDDDGKATLTILLDSVDTAIDIRDERMREMLFETGDYPVATVTLAVPAELLDLSPGERRSTAVEASLELHGASKAVTAQVLVARLDEEQLLVTTESPVLIDAAAFDLAGGLEALRAVAGLPGITPAVPVTFVLSFEPALDF